MMLEKANKIIKIFILIFLVLGGFFVSSDSQASIRKEFNYQGKLTNNAGVNVVDGAYDVVFKIYTQAGGGTAAWTESWTAAALFTEATTTMTNDGCATGVDKIAYVTGANESSLKAGQTLWNATTKQSAVIESVVAASNYICIYDPQAAWTSGNQVTNRIYIKNGLFSAMVGSVTDQTIQFTGSTYYLGVTVGADSEMIPRKKIGSVPQAWNSNNIVGSGIIDIDNTSTATDAANINYNPASGAYSALSVVYGSGGGTGTALSVSQAGTGNIVDFKDGATSVFTIADGGNITMNALSFTQNAVNPVHKGAITDDGTTELVEAHSIYVSGKYAYVANCVAGGVEILDISNPASPTHVGAITDDGTTELAGAMSIYVSGKYAYVASYSDSGVEILDISNPASPTHVGAITDDGTTELAGAMSIYVSGKYAYVASYADNGVEILDISNPASPTHVGAITDNGTTELVEAHSIYVSGKYAYVASADGVEILDISNPASPTHVGAITDDGTTELAGAMSIYVSGKYAYVASYSDSGVEILDISNPASPTHVGAITDDGTTELDGAMSIYVSGKYAYVTSTVDDGVEILDISNPASPTHVGAITDNGTTELDGASGIYVSGKYAYVAGYADDGVEILDLAGFDIPTASIGDLNVSTLDVTDNASVANNLYVGNGLNVGPGGVYSTGPMSTYVNSTATALTVSQSGTGPLMDILDTGVSIFRVGQATVEITRPLDLQVEGDVGVEYNLSFLNNASSYINSAGPLIISAGDTNSYENLTLTTSGTGDVVIDIASSVLGLKVVGLAGQVFSIDPSGNVTIGGTDSGDGNLTVKGNISTQGGNLDLNSLATPAGIVVTPTGTAGATTYGYRISAINDNGQTLAAATATTTTGNAALSATNYNRISWGVVPGATGYKVYGRTSGFELLMTTINSPTLMYDDTGAATPSGALPTTNTTGGNNITYAAADGPKRSIILTAAGAEVPATGGPAQTKIAGTNHTYYVLDFDAATDESAYWHWTMPDSYDGGKIDITYYWEAAATSAEVGWCFQAVGIAPNNAEDIDVALSAASLANCAIDTAQGNANDLASIASTQVVSNFSAGEYVAFKVFRDADGSTVGAGNDDMTGDARLVKVKIEYSVNAESD